MLLVPNETEQWTGRHAAKDALRERVWSALVAAGSVSDDPRGSIPDFRTADAAAARLATLPEWTGAEVVKCTPDACQAPIRRRALQQGKTLYMAYPQLAVYPCFIELSAVALPGGVTIEEASTMDGAIAHGRPVPFEAMRHIDLVNVGSVAVTAAGGRTGKGAGFADLELALLRDRGLVDDRSVIATTVDPISLVRDEDVPMTATDSSVDLVVTADRVIRSSGPRTGPVGIDWERLAPDQIDSIPILATLAAARLG